MIRKLYSLQGTRIFSPFDGFKEVLPARIAQKPHQLSGQPIFDIFIGNLMNDSVKCGLKRNYSCSIHFPSPTYNSQLTTSPSQLPSVYPEYYGVIGTPMVKKTLLRYAPRPWGMQPNTSLAANFPRSPWAFHCSCLCVYYTIFGSQWGLTPLVSARRWPRCSGHMRVLGDIFTYFRFLARVTSCVIFKTARFSSIVVLVDSVERLSPMSAASLCPACVNLAACSGLRPSATAGPPYPAPSPEPGRKFR